MEASVSAAGTREGQESTPPAAACSVANPRISGDLDVSSTSIKLHWTCEPLESCQGSWKLQARCRPDGSRTGPWGRPGNTMEQSLQGVGGAVTCRPLQPFSFYNVTISGSDPATRPARPAVLYSRRGRTRETPHGLCFSPAEPAIPANVTALRVSSISPASGTALLHLQPLPGLHGPIREYQIIVSATQNDSQADACPSVALPPLASSAAHDTYLAAVLPTHNLTGPMDFVLGDGAQQHGY
nr:uncharacterized protein LOC106732952 [Pelodiscus sinensis]|eukprot:XP_025034069.1 uncharacterized protein LOC106732952 [Pelodiscus sinensis]